MKKPRIAGLFYVERRAVAMRLPAPNPIPTVIAVLLLAGGLLYTWLAAAPGFDDWLAQGTHREDAQRYQRYLATQGVGTALPLPALLSVSRDAERCRVAPWILPPQPLWPDMVPTLRLLQALQARGLIRRADTIASAYRDSALNACAGGRPQSRHLRNNALDVRLEGRDRESRLRGLCAFWRQEGAGLAFGLGFYANGQIHIDSGGYRSWGGDYTGRSSPCRR